MARNPSRRKYDMHTLVIKMLKKRDVSSKITGKTISRRDALVELLWDLVYNSEGIQALKVLALRALLEYSSGKPITSDKLKQGDIEEREDINLSSYIERENYLDELLEKRKAEREAEKQKEKDNIEQKEGVKDEPSS